MVDFIIDLLVKGLSMDYVLWRWERKQKRATRGLGQESAAQANGDSRRVGPPGHCSKRRPRWLWPSTLIALATMVLAGSLAIGEGIVSDKAGPIVLGVFFYVCGVVFVFSAVRYSAARHNVNTTDHDSD